MNVEEDDGVFQSRATDCLLTFRLPSGPSKKRRRLNGHPMVERIENRLDKFVLDHAVPPSQIDQLKQQRFDIKYLTLAQALQSSSLQPLYVKRIFTGACYGTKLVQFGLQVAVLLFSANGTPARCFV